MKTFNKAGILSHSDEMFEILPQKNPKASKTLDEVLLKEIIKFINSKTRKMDGAVFIFQVTLEM